MFTRTVFLLVVVISLARPAYTQEIESLSARNAVYLELAGSGILYSVNYEHRISRNLSLRAGFSKWSASVLFLKVSDFTAFPLMINYLTGGRRGNFEFGLGVLVGKAFFEEAFFGTSLGEESFVLGTGTLGYRYQPVDGGFVFRVGFTPVFSSDNIAPLFGLSVGHSF